MSSREHGQQGMGTLSTESQILGELQTLALSPGFIHAIAHAAASDTFAKREGSSPHDRLNVKELTLVAGLMAVQPFDSIGIPDEKGLAEQVAHLYMLLKRLHEAVTQPMTDRAMSMVAAKLPANATESNVPLTSASGSEMVEPFFYVGTGAYDFQYLDLAEEKYRYDSDWLESNVGLSLGLMVSAARKLQELRESRFPSFLQAQTHAERCNSALATFSFTRNDMSLLSDKEFEAFINKFTVVPGEVKPIIDGVGSVNELEYKPIMRLAEDNFFMPVGFMLAKSIYESPFYWMTGDNDYKDQANAHRGRATEELADRLLTPIFGDNVIRNVTVAKVGSKQQSQEIDVLAFTGNRAVAVQAKSKRLTASSRQGDEESIKRDFAQAVQEAYEQGLLSRQLLLGGEHVLNDLDGNQFNLPNSLEEVYLVCLTLDHFPALPHTTERFLEKTDGDPSPVAMSLLDLDIIATYLTEPLDFLHYMYQRSRWSGPIYGSCEVSFLGLYLSRGLALPQEVQGVLLTESMAGLIDEDFPTRRGRYQMLSKLLGMDVKVPDDGGLKNRWQNSELHHFISLLDKSPDPRATDAAFMLLDLPQKDSSYFRERIVEAMNECNRSGNICGCCIALQGGSGISFVWMQESSAALRKEVLYNHAIAYKYKYKSDQWLGLGGTLARPDIALVFSREPWQADSELDELARMLLHPETGGKKPGRNQPCWCGSEQKYKKCHL